MFNGASYSQQQQQQQQQQYYQQQEQQEILQQRQQRRAKLFNINFRNVVRNDNSQVPASPPYAVVPSFMVTIQLDCTNL